MSVQRINRVKDQTTSTGTGTVTISLVAPTGYQTFAAHTSGATVRYLIIGTSEWEVGQGVWTSGTNTLTRATVYTSSNSNNLVNFSAGTKTVITTPTAIDLDEIGNVWGFTTTATAAGTTTLTVTSDYQQFFTGTTTQTVVMPVTTTLTAGWAVAIINNSTGNITVNSSGGNLIYTVLPSTSALFTCILATGTTAASWNAEVNGFSGVLGFANGGTNSSATPTAGGAAYGTGTAIAVNAAGTAGQVLTSNGSSAPTWTTVSGAVANGTMYENNLTVTSNYTLTTNKNALSVGPITISAGVTVTVPSGQRWVVL